MPIKFNGQEIPDFIRVNKINNPLLPPIEQATVEVMGRPGAYDYGNKLGSRKIEVEVTIVSDSVLDTPARRREFIDWLYYEEPKELTLLDEPDKVYYAKATGDTDIEEVLKTGKGTITFVCHDPYAYKLEQSQPITTGEEPTIINNTGQTETFPRFRFEFGQATTEFAVTKNENEFIYFGQPAPVDEVEPAEPRTLILHDDCSSVAGYTAGVNVDGGVIAGSLESTGNYIKATEFGNGENYTGWHGPAGIKSLGQAVQDFTIEIKLSFKSVYDYQIGKIEFYLLDINSNIIGKFAIRDSNKSNNPLVEARAGAESGGRYFANHYRTFGHYKYFEGIMRFQRIGQEYTFTVARTDSNGNLYNIDTYRWYDKDGLYQVPLGGYQIYFAAHSNYEVISTFYIDDIKIWNENTLDPVTEIPNVFVPGDILEIDCNSGIILKNNEPYYYTLAPSSTFISLDKGANEIRIAPGGVINEGTIYYKERFL